jgi:hypothetical protein
MAAARMQAREEPGVLYLLTTCRTFNIDWFERPLFKDMLFREPCRGCGSNHSLLREIHNEEGAPLYEYRCNVIDPTPLYEDDDITQVKLRFRLGTRTFAIDCGHDLDQALQRLAILRGNRPDDSDVQGAFDSFTNEVRRLCIMEENWRLRG